MKGIPHRGRKPMGWAQGAKVSDMYKLQLRFSTSPSLTSITALAACLWIGRPAQAQFGQPGVVAFQPTIGSLLDGAALSVTPVVSADRRYVRLGVTPYFNAVEGFSTVVVPGAVSGGGGFGAGGVGGGGAGGFRMLGAGALGAPQAQAGSVLRDPLAQAYVRASQELSEAGVEQGPDHASGQRAPILPEPDQGARVGRRARRGSGVRSPSAAVPVRAQRTVRQP